MEKLLYSNRENSSLRAIMWLNFLPQMVLLNKLGKIDRDKHLYDILINFEAITISPSKLRYLGNWINSYLGLIKKGRII